MIVALAEDIAAGTVLLALNSKSFSCCEITVAPCSFLAAPDVGLLPFKLAKFPWCQVAGSEATPDSCLLPPFSLINSGSRGLVSKRQKNHQAADKCCEYLRFHRFVSLLRIVFIIFNPEGPRRLR